SSTWSRSLGPPMNPGVCHILAGCGSLPQRAHHNSALLSQPGSRDKDTAREMHEPQHHHLNSATHSSVTSLQTKTRRQVAPDPKPTPLTWSATEFEPQLSPSFQTQAHSYQHHK